MNRVANGLGNVVERFTRWTGIKRLVDARADARREKLAAELLADTEIIVKSFMRQDSLLRFVRSVRRFYPTLPIRVVDDSSKMTPDGEAVKAAQGVTWHSMPFDSGLPGGRNLAVRQSRAKYVVVCDDDYEFTTDTDLAALLLPLHASNIDLCGGLVRMDGKVAQNWCGRLSFQESRGKRTIRMRADRLVEEEIEGVRVYRTDITYNFFAARRAVLAAYPWDERYKITCEHLDSFLTWKMAGVRVAYTVDCVCNHVHSGDAAYQQKRKRNTSDLLLKKWQASGRTTAPITRFPGI
ncbi:MAG: glycosyltransferase [Pirellulales bacterium]|nr:glycosyltransferase [Pirellulales bacterium]